MPSFSIAAASARIPSPEAFSERKSSSIMTTGKRNFMTPLRDRVPGRPTSRGADYTRFIVVFACAALGGWCAGAAAQTYPERPIKLVVGQPPGSGPDKIARLFAEQLFRFWQASV